MGTGRIKIKMPLVWGGINDAGFGSRIVLGGVGWTVPPLWAKGKYSLPLDWIIDGAYFPTSLDRISGIGITIVFVLSPDMSCRAER